jgi:hypothetical protein
MAKGLALFLREAAAFHEYREVLWAAERYRALFPVNPMVEICSAVAYVATGDHNRALSLLEDLWKHGYEPAEVTSHARSLLGRTFQPREITPTAVLGAIADAVKSARPKVFHPMHGN